MGGDRQVPAWPLGEQHQESLVRAGGARVGYSWRGCANAELRQGAAAGAACWRGRGIRAGCKHGHDPCVIIITGSLHLHDASGTWHRNATLRSKAEAKGRTLLGLYGRVVVEQQGSTSIKAFQAAVAAYQTLQGVDGIETMQVMVTYKAMPTGVFGAA